jgi:pimeloyl-ACP methyl ester carboxylesterase
MGGVVITQTAETNAGKIAALVYLSAFLPENGKSLQDYTQDRESKLGPGLEIDTEQASARSRPRRCAQPSLTTRPRSMPKRDSNASAPSRCSRSAPIGEPSGPPAWKTIPSWDLIGTADDVIPPAEQAFMAARAHSTVVRIPAHHLSLVSNPDAVTALIIAAARTVSRQPRLKLPMRG